MTYKTRELLNRQFLQVDGNFHLPQSIFAPGPFLDPSYIGDGGFWSVQSVFENYIEAMNANVPPKSEVSEFLFLKKHEINSTVLD